MSLFLGRCKRIRQSFVANTFNRDPEESASVFSGGAAGEYSGINNLITLRSSFQNAIEEWMLPLPGTADLQVVAQVPQPPTEVSDTRANKF